MDSVLSEEEHRRLFEERLAERRAVKGTPFATTARVVFDVDMGAAAASPAPASDGGGIEGWHPSKEHTPRQTGSRSPDAASGKPAKAESADGQSARRHRLGSAEHAQERDRRRQEQLEAMRREQAEKEREECPFKPQINRGYVPRARNYLGTFERLSRPMKDEWQRREEQRRMKDADLPFKPKLSPNTELYASRRQAGHMEDLGERLYREAEELTRRQQRRHLEQSMKEADAMRSPASNPPRSPPHRSRSQAASDPGGPSPAFRRPLHERVADIRRERQEHLKYLREKWTEEHAHRPRVNPRQGGREDDDVDVVERLTAPREPRHDPESSVAKAERSMQDTPKISAHSSVLALGRDEFVEHQDWRDRLLAWGHEHERRLQCLKEETDRATGGKHKRVSEKHFLDFVDSLQQKAKARDMKLAEQRREQVRGLFQPALRSSSAPPRPPSRQRQDSPRTGAAARESRMARIEEHLREKEEKACTFAPEIDVRSRQLAERKDRRTDRRAPYGKNPTVAVRLQDEKMRQRRAQTEECTFQPVLASQHLRGVDPAPVAGMDSFMRRSEQARAMQREQRARAVTAHQVKPSAVAGALREDRGGRLHTVPKPFVLSSGTRAPRRYSPEGTFTFHPQTEGATRERVLRSVLEPDTATDPISEAETMSDGVPPPHFAPQQAWPVSPPPAFSAPAARERRRSSLAVAAAAAVADADD